MKLESLKNEKFSNEKIQPHGMGLVFGGEKVHTVWTDKLHDYYEDANNNGKQDRDECLVFIAPPKKTLSE
jgi:hypothetical protein